VEALALKEPTCGPAAKRCRKMALLSPAPLPTQAMTKVPLPVAAMPAAAWEPCVVVLAIDTGVSRPDAVSWR
jgi:hypothetical protein